MPVNPVNKLPARWRVVLGHVAGWMLAVGIVAVCAGAAMRYGDLKLLLIGVGGLLSAVACILALISRRAVPIQLCVLGGVIAAIYLPGTQRACCAGTEAGAIGALRSINSGQASYAESCAAGGFAIDLADLVRSPSGSSQGFVHGGLSRNGVIWSGYVITLARDARLGVTDVGAPAETCNRSASQPASGYVASASPVKPGTRYFATDARGTLFYSTTGAVPNPIPPGASIVQ